MFNNYFRVFLRNIRRNSFFTFLNVLGLTLGIGVSFVIVLYVTDELSFDKFHKDGNLIHTVGLKGVLSGNTFEGMSSCAPLSAALTNEAPAVAASTRVSRWGDLMIHKDNNIVMQDEVIIADSNFFHFFTFELLAGSIDKVLIQPKGLVLTESTAHKFFGETPYNEIVGQALIVGNDKESYQVTGIAADPPKNSHIEFRAILSMATWDFSKRTQWTSNSLMTYFKLHPTASVGQVQARLDEFVEKYVGPEVQQYLGVSMDEFRESGGDYGYFTVPLFDIHFSTIDSEFGGKGNRQNVMIFSIVALFVLLIAAVNFVNLSTAKATDRAKEIGIRKSIGAYREQLIYQFLFESVLLVLIAAVFALMLVMASFTYLNELTGKAFTYEQVLTFNLLIYYLPIVVLIGVIAGFYPSLVLSAYRPVEVIKGNPHATNTNRFNPRNLLVGFQFTLTTLAIILTIVITRQLNLMRNYDLGFDKEQVLVISNAKGLPNPETFKNELNQLATVSNASLTYNYPPRVYSNSVFRLEDTQQDILFFQYYADKDHAASIGLQMAQGRFFEDPGLDENSVIINETGFKQSGWETIDGKRILEIGNEEEGGFKAYHVVGVVKDFHYEDFKTEIRPMLMFCSKDGNYVTLKVKGEDALATIRTVEDMWIDMTGGKPFEYTFVDQQFEKLFSTERQLANLTILFSILTIVTASLGLFGLAAFVARRRRKEFGIRKILGAHEGVIWLLQFRYFASIALVALIIAVPIAYYLTSIWLEGFVYRINNGFSIYSLATLGVVLIILISVGYQSLKASRVSPASVLREE